MVLAQEGEKRNLRGVRREGGAEPGVLQRGVDEPLVRRAGAQYSAAGTGAAARHPSPAGSGLHSRLVQR